MSKPVQQHYLPKAAYLRFFEIPRKPGFVYFYQRGLDPIIVNVHNIAKERHLYSFVGQDGEYNYEIEAALAELEERSRPILAGLNDAHGSVHITALEKGVLTEFITYQAVRTPAFRQSLQDLSSEFAKLHMMTLAQNKHALANVLEKVKQTNLNKYERDISVDEMQEFILGEEYTVESSGDYYLGQSLKLGEHIFPAILMKQFSILRVEGENLITSDHPVALIRDPQAPLIYGSGFLMSRILFPIGRHTALYLSNEKNTPELSDPNQLIQVPCKTITRFQARQLNKYTIGHAEEYLFASEHNQSLRNLFAATERQSRVVMSNPFSRKDKKP